MYGYIYKRQNKLNGKIYIGQHKYSKFEIDESYEGSGTLFKEVLKKVGRENFSYELLDSAETQDELNYKEQLWIKEYDCIAPKGYNLNSGGLQYEASDITKERISEAVKQLWKNPEYRESARKNMSKGHIGISSGMKGRKFMDDELIRFRENSLGRAWYNNGIEEVFVYECPEGFRKGRIINPKFSECGKGRRWVTNGEESIYCKPEFINDYLAKGYVFGRTLNYTPSEETRKKMSEAQYKRHKRES